MKILVLGGTKFFGAHLVRRLIQEGHHVIVATRGRYQFDFKNQVQFEIADRNSLTDLQRLATLGPFDLIYDQVCWYAKNARDAVTAFNDVCKRYVFTSTGSVYDPANGLDLTEDLFDYKSYQINLNTPVPYDYQEEKRQSEAIFSQSAKFELVMPRFTYVVGPDDYTERLKFHVDKITHGEEIYFPNIDAKTGFIQSSEAGEFLAFIGKHSYCGAVNVTSGVISLRELMQMIEQETGKKLIQAQRVDDKNRSPYGAEIDFLQTNQLAKSLGFKFQEIRDFMPKLIKFFQ